MDVSRLLCGYSFCRQLVTSYKSYLLDCDTLILLSPLMTIRTMVHCEMAQLIMLFLITCTQTQLTLLQYIAVKQI